MLPISKNRLEILLEKCSPYKDPKIYLEQYVTPTRIAADLLNLAFLKGDIQKKVVFDLGCGIGRLAIGAFLLGAQEVKGFDIDCEILKSAEQNALNLKAKVEWVCLDIAILNEECDTVIQNPPFGARVKGADRAFLKAAIRSGKVIYTMHKTSTRAFVENYIEKLEGEITDLKSIEFDLHRSYSFHKKRIKRIKVDIYRIERRD